jgi:hypothetical protein
MIKSKNGSIIFFEILWSLTTNLSGLIALLSFDTKHSIFHNDNDFLHIHCLIMAKENYRLLLL